MNISEGERIAAVLEGLGFRRTDNEQVADVLGVVACSVRQKAIDKVYSKIALWNEWKKRRALLTFATGCILPADMQKLLKRFDLIFGIQELGNLPQMIREYGVPMPQSYVTPSVARHDRESAEGRRQVTAGSKSTARGMAGSGTEHLAVTPHYGSDIEAFLPIQNGCDKFCTFCAVPYTRGREVSRPSEDIFAEVAGLLDRDYKTITLLGQNVNSYGLDKPGVERSFPELLRGVAEQIAERGKECWVYFTSPHPRDFSDELLEIMAQYPQVAKQVHLPLQSGDDKLLMRMNRNYNMGRYRALVENIRTTLPGATLFTDIIVGFCGESSEQFENTRLAMREFKYHMAYIASYSPRPGAASSRWADDVPPETKRQRLHDLTLELHQTAGAHNAALVGERVRFLVTGRDRKGQHLIGRTEGKINGRIIGVKGNSAAASGAADAAMPDDDALIGSIVDMEVSAANGLSIEGHLWVNAAGQQGTAGKPGGVRRGDNADAPVRENLQTV